MFVIFGYTVSKKQTPINTRLIENFAEKEGLALYL